MQPTPVIPLVQVVHHFTQELNSYHESRCPARHLVQSFSMPSITFNHLYLFVSPPPLRIPALGHRPDTPVIQHFVASLSSLKVSYCPSEISSWYIWVSVALFTQNSLLRNRLPPNFSSQTFPAKPPSSFSLKSSIPTTCFSRFPYQPLFQEYSPPNEIAVEWDGR